MSCNNNNNPCKDLGCLYPSNTDCVWLKGIDTNCLGIKNKDLLTDALNTLISEVCSLSPSGIPNNVVVNNSDGNLDVNFLTVGNTTTYTVNLNSDIITDITNLQINVGALTACCSNTITGADLIGGTDIGITDNGDGTFTIDYIGTPTPVYDGIVYNDFQPIAGSGGITNLPQELKSYNENYTNFNISNGDEIRYVLEGQLASDNTIATVDDIIVDWFNAGAFTVVSTITFDSFNSGRIGDPVNYTSWRIEGTLSVKDANTGLCSLTTKLIAYPKVNGLLSNGHIEQFYINGTVAGVDFTNLSLRLFYVRNTNSNINNYAQRFMVEIRKAI